ncbi:RagB/SusD family nutrient uptake outer membrane protein [Echinicola jeungdonensis]|uniref:RagB/SusD family nutrient uptake outer membrane protein n=1 Tax=Echinicola jeungdonensis TaxID=709343 RepID=UPI0025B55E31|nr:RagB/SusD family nutrient uptake outer membrane protein [Echinicola jeungdonensis]MDN3671221.1 RagB/SusD family nutrient uptake outer membrane protein [Echinicola jeungdonensis]
MLEVLPDIQNLSSSQAAAIEGEARFVRALVYFDLLKIFGGVPIVTDFVTTTSEVSLAGRASETEVYNFIIEDLEFAENNLGNTPNAPFRANNWAATALLARVHLQVGNYALAIQKATEVINAGYILLPNYGDISRIKGNNEMIFELNFTNNVGDQNGLAISSDPSTSGQKFYVRPAFYNAFVASANQGDERFSTSVLEQGNNLRVIKYFRVSTSDDNVPILRLAEMYLIRAEANARRIGSGFTTGAIIDDINIIRQRADLDPLLLTDIPTIAGALEEILEQRRFELPLRGTATQTSEDTAWPMTCFLLVKVSGNSGPFHCRSWNSTKILSKTMGIPVNKTRKKASF